MSDIKTVKEIALRKDKNTMKEENSALQDANKALEAEKNYLTRQLEDATAIVEKYNNSVVSKLDSKYAMSNFGLEDNRLEHDGNKYQISLKTEDGKGTIVRDIELGDKSAAAVEEIGEIQNITDAATIANAWNIHCLRTVAKNNGFKSVGEFAHLQFPKLSTGYANQLANAAEAFLEEKDGKVTYKYDWCDNVTISSLTLIMGAWNEYNKDFEKPDPAGFYDKYIKPDNDDKQLIPIRASQPVLKKAISALNSANGKTTRKGKNSGENKPEKPEIDVKTALAMVTDWFIENNDLADETANTYTDMLISIDIMYDRITKKNTENKA